MRTLKQVEKILERDFRKVRARVKKAMDDSPKSVTLRAAIIQQKLFAKTAVTVRF